MQEKSIIKIINEKVVKTHGYLAEQQKLIEKLIAETPTGELRNKLTDINILGSLAQVELTNF